MGGGQLRHKKVCTKKSDEEIEKRYGISRERHENRNDICNELPTGKIRIKDPDVDTMLYVDDAGRDWRRNPDIVSSYHQPMSMPNAVFHSIVDMLIFCVDFPVPNMKFISENEDKTWSEVICNRYTGELIVDPVYFGTSNFCKDAPNGMKTGALTTTQHVNLDVKPHEKYGPGYKHIAKGIPVGHYDGDIPHPVILHEPLGGPKAIYMSPQNDPKSPQYDPNYGHKRPEEVSQTGDSITSISNVPPKSTHSMYPNVILDDASGSLHLDDTSLLFSPDDGTPPQTWKWTSIQKPMVREGSKLIKMVFYHVVFHLQTSEELKRLMREIQSKTS